MEAIKVYLQNKGIAYKESNGELITKCLFSNCDNDSYGPEAHLYFDIKTSQYHCKKCAAKGNIITLKKHFGETAANQIENKPKRNLRTLTPRMVEDSHNNLTPEIIQYLNNRGITDDIIKENKIGYGNIYGKNWITIPIKDINGNYSFLKLRRNPKEGNEKMTWPNGIEAQIYSWEDLMFAQERLLICEGEMDALLMKSKGVPCITNTHGAGTVKQEWMNYFKPEIEYYICYDNDNTGKSGAKKMADALLKQGCNKIKIVTLPEEIGEKGDLGDYVVRLNLAVEDLFTKYVKEYPEKIDSTKFKELSLVQVCKILDSTIKKDDANKAITFLTMLTTYTEEAQTNVFFNAPSSTGKSHIPLSVSELFPAEDKIILAHCSPTAFFHEQGKADKEKNEIIVDLSRKILIFTDMPDSGLLSRLRSILSHDMKESRFKTTDKNQQGGNRTKTVVVIGYPSVYFCSAGLRVNEQESTRFIMLSPSIGHDKIIQGIKQTIAKESDREKFLTSLNVDMERTNLKERILGVKQEMINDIKIDNADLIEKLFLRDSANVQPRQQRDIKKIISLIKGLALLNLWFRKREGNYVFANDKDIEGGFKLWSEISFGQDYGLPPYIMEIYTKIILRLWNESDSIGIKDPVSRKKILDLHFKIYHRPLGITYLRQHILPQLEEVGLIVQERNTNDSREMVVIPLETNFEIELPEVKVEI